jgi:hypothetical protein
LSFGDRCAAAHRPQGRCYADFRKTKS